MPNPNENRVVWSAVHCEESMRLCAVLEAATIQLDAAEAARALMKGDAAGRREEQRARRRYNDAAAALGAFLDRMHEEYAVTAS